MLMKFLRKEVEKEEQITMAISGFSFQENRIKMSEKSRNKFKSEVNIDNIATAVTVVTQRKLCLFKKEKYLNR